jgi:hypothetical protein
MADKIEVKPDGTATITKDTGEVITMPAEELLRQRPDLVTKARGDRVLAGLNVEVACRDELHPLQPGPLDIGDTVFVRNAREFGEVQRKVGDAFRVRMRDGRIETRWPLELERRA